MDVGGSSGNSSAGTDRMAQLVALRKNFAAFLKAKSNKNIAESAQQEASEQLLIQFLKVCFEKYSQKIRRNYSEKVIYSKESIFWQ
jgi:hypothetical protein